MNTLPPEANTSLLWLIIVGFCLIGLAFVADLLRRLRREEDSRAQGTTRRTQVLWKIPKVLLTPLLVCYGLRGALKGDVWLPGRSSPGLHLRGGAGWLFFAASLCAAAFVTADLLQCYAGQAGGRRYKVYMCITGFLAWSVLGLSIAWSMWGGAWGPK